jgi:hypothetical protein
MTDVRGSRVVEHMARVLTCYPTSPAELRNAGKGGGLAKCNV